MTQPLYVLRSLAVSFGGRQVLGPIDLELTTGSFIAIVGPNGSGKTTLLRALTGAVRPSGGEIAFEGRALSDYQPLELARSVGVVPQHFTLDFSFTVEEVVAMGRYARVPRIGRTTWVARGGSDSADNARVASALESTGLSDLADRPITRLSGGERQRALIAQTLAQDTPVLLLDEPLNNLDLNHQLETMQLLRDLHAGGRTIVVVLHDLNMAAQYCDELLMLDQGRVVARGIPEDVLEPQSILEVFRTRVSVHKQGRRPYVTPIWSDAVTGRPQTDAKRVHIVAGGGAASGLIEELVVRGFAPSVGVVSVFDTDYATAQAYELEVVSAPPFEAFSTETMREFDALAAQADAVVVAPVFFGRGNLAPLRSVLQRAQAGAKVIVMSQPPISDRDLSGGEATALIAKLRESGALMVETVPQAAEAVCS